MFAIFDLDFTIEVQAHRQEERYVTYLCVAFYFIHMHILGYCYPSGMSSKGPSASTCHGTRIAY